MLLCLSSALLTEVAPQVSARPRLGWEDLVRPGQDDALMLAIAISMDRIEADEEAEREAAEREQHPFIPPPRAGVAVAAGDLGGTGPASNEAGGACTSS